MPFASSRVLGVDLGARARRADRDALAAQVLEARDAAVGEHDDLHRVGIDRRERAQLRQLPVLEGAGAGVGLVDRVGQRQGEVAVAAG
jgi:hypothetical protein